MYVVYFFFYEFFAKINQTSQNSYSWMYEFTDCLIIPESWGVFSKLVFSDYTMSVVPNRLITRQLLWHLMAKFRTTFDFNRIGRDFLLVIFNWFRVYLVQLIYSYTIVRDTYT